MCEQALISSEAKKLFIKNSMHRLRLLTTLNLLVSVDKRDTMRLYNKLHRNIAKVVASGFGKKIEAIFTGLSINGTTKMQQYL